MGGSLESLADLQLPSTLSSVQLEGAQLIDPGALAQVTRVDGDVVLAGDRLRDATSLARLESIGGSLILSALSLENVNGLEHLTGVGGDITTEWNPMLENLNGLEQLQFVGGDIILMENSLLENLDGWTRPLAVHGLQLFGTGLRHLDLTGMQVESIVISDNWSLEEITDFGPVDPHTQFVPYDFSEIHRRIETIIVFQNSSLRHFTMPAGRQGAEYIAIGRNDALEVLDLGQMANIDLLSIRENQRLDTVSLGALSTVDWLIVQQNPALSLDVFDGVKTFERQMSP
jgi:hypothetical protein